jgi:putative ABC transport system permease protein
VHVVGHAELPAATAGRPALLVDRARLRSAARRASIADPGPGASGLLWARGPAQRVERALAASNLGATFFTTPNHIFSDGSVAAAKRSYGYVKVIGAAAAVLSLLALLLYLQARQRGQALASAFARRMGLAPTADVSALVVEAVAIVLFAAVLGTAVALLTAGPIVGHVDALPQYAPSPVLVVPWTALAAATGAAALAAALVGAAAAALAARADASEALRVA